jgi:hypothetical protein
MRPLFSDAPVMQAAPMMSSPQVGSQLAAALSHPSPMPDYSWPQAPQIPLSTMMQAAQAQQTPTAAAMNATPANNSPGGIIQPTNGPWTASTDAPPAPPNWLQHLMPQMPGQISGANPNTAPQVPGMIGGGGSNAP